MLNGLEVIILITLNLIQTGHIVEFNVRGWQKMVAGDLDHVLHVTSPAGSSSSFTLGGICVRQ